MTRHLNAVEGVRKVLEQQSIEYQPALIMEFIDGETLLDIIAGTTLNLRARIEIAIGITRILGKIHRHNILHLDINSKNILIGNMQQSVHIIDFGTAFHIDRTGQLKVHPDQVLGTLPYISPEQTGRINRAVDERSDLYSLGIVLYELMTGQLPFDSSDPMDLVHHHIARIPVSPSEVSTGIPEVLSAIILKLLSKNAGDRYQSATGVQSDLEKCLQRLSPEDTIEGFPLGEIDYAGRLRFRQKLYGRDRELNELESAFESVCRDTSSIVIVGGYSGIGKTALVEEIQRPVSQKNGYFIEGKFDQLATTPYAGIIQAFALFTSQILAQTETQLEALRSKILEAVGPNGRVLTDVVPSLELVIGPQSAVPDLSGQEAQNRFNYVFQRFFGAIAQSEHPICFFLDDLQWIDPGSLGLLKYLFSSPDLAHLLVVGAYRDNEVHEDHPLMTFIADLEKAGVNLKQMTLHKLSEADVEALISDVLRCDPGEIRELSRVVYSQTDGNPFFTRQVLRSLEDQGLITLDTAAGHWRWDLDSLRDLDVADGVVELLVGRLEELPTDIQETLKMAACIGIQFDFATLTVVTESDDDAILGHVREAVAAGLMWERDDRGYFVHDRVQEAAYTLAPMEERDLLHLTIGRLLLQRHGASDHEQDLYKIVDQLNHGLHLVEDEQEQIQIARLNLQAARAARQANAFETGLTYARAGIELLGENSWDEYYQLTQDLEEQAALLAYMSGDIPGMEYHGGRVLQFGRDPLDLARVRRAHMEFLAGSKHHNEALDMGIEALRELGWDLPAEPDWEFAISRVAALNERLEREPPEWLAMRPLDDQDPQLAAAFDISTTLASTAFVARPPLCPLLLVINLEHCLTLRLLPASIPYLLSFWACYESGLLNQPEAAVERCESALRLAEEPAFRSTQCRALEHFGVFVLFWVRHLQETLDLFLRAIRAALDSGDNEFCAYSVAGWPKHAFYASVDLAEVEARSLELRAITDAIQFDTISLWVNIYVTAARLLRGTSSVNGMMWRGTLFDEDRDLPALLQTGDLIGPLYLYSTKAWLATLFGDHSIVEEQTDLVEPYLAAATGALDSAIVAFVFCLRRARELRELPADPDRDRLLRENVDFLERSARHAPMNFAHKLSLVRAEVFRARGEVLPAMQAYEKAAQGAMENGYLSESGLAYALAAEFYQDLGLHQAALHNLHQAAQAWRSWGAHALVESLSQRFADLPGLSDLSWQSSGDAGKVQTIITQPITPFQLDVESIISASQLLVAETNLDQLCTQMMDLVMANSGAERAVLLLKQEDEWFVQARKDLTTDEHTALFHQPFDPTDRETELIPESVFNYCQRTQDVLVLGDAQLDHRFAEDRLIKNTTQSIACLPSLGQGKLRAMLYLENNQTADVFTPENVELLKHLSSQFAISVENALLYDSLEKTVRELQVSDERYKLAVSGSTAALWDWDISSNMVHYSDRVTEVLEYSPGEFSDSLDEFWNRIHPDDYRATQQAVDQHLNDQAPFQVDYRLQAKSGRYRWFHARGQAIWDETGRAMRMSGSITDITERKQVEEELRRSEEHFRSLMEGSPLAIEILTPDGQIIQVNAAWMSLWGVNEEETAQALADYNMLTDKQVEELGILPLVEKAFSGQPVVLPPIQYHASRAAEEVGLAQIEARSRWIQCHLYSVKDANGEIDHVVNVYLDITDLRQAEQEALEQREALARVDRTTSMGQLTGSISHELNQPLTGILSNAQAAEMMIESGQWEEEEMSEIMADIVADAKRAGDVIRILRQLYREQRVEFLPIDINAIVEETTKLLHSEFIIQRVMLTTQFDSSLPWVNGNRVQIQQVLVNLIMNASQAMNDKTGEDRRILITTEYDADEVKVSVDDNGSGIDPNVIDGIFEPLATWKPGHTGMGLAISNSIIKAHGGRMWAKNRPGGGARVGFALPVTNKEDEP